MSLTILVLSEDNGKEAYETVSALARRMFRLIVSGWYPREDTFQPLSDAQAQAAVRGNLWKSTKGPQWSLRQKLLRTLATKLLEGDRSFVIFHIDGDCAWAERKRSENVAKFALFKEELGRLIGMFLQQRRRPAPTAYSLQRLLVLMPFWCMESWLYQNTTEAVRLCREQHGGRDEDVFLAWQRDRATLDDEPYPKKRTCLGAQHNRALAERAYPADEVYALGKSFAACVDGLLGCEALCAALAEMPGSPDPPRL